MATATPDTKTSRRIYERLMWLLPADFRAAYGEPLAQTFVDMCAAEIDARGARGLLAVWSRALPDLCSAAAREWTARMLRDGAGGRPPVASRLVATLVPATAAIVVAYSQVRYPANLTRTEYAVGYAAVLGILGAVAVALAIGRLAAPTVVLCALATAPVLVVTFEVASQGAVAAAMLAMACLIAIASSAKSASLGARVRAGALAGALSGIVMLVVTTVDGLATMRSVGQDKVYLAEFLRSGQQSLPAYVMGERIFGGLVLTVLAAIFGAVVGVVWSALRHHR
jgi:hypothetical protein